jgi:bacteriocin-like protein
MKNFANLNLEVLSTEELMAIKGGKTSAPIDVIIIREEP